MPMRPRRPCPHGGCTTLTDGGPCPKHAVQRQREQDARRGSATSRGYDRRHERWRDAVIARDPLCVDPFGVHRAANRIEPTTVADHKVPIRKGGARFDLNNGQGLCASCHGRKTALEDGGFGRKASR